MAVAAKRRGPKPRPGLPKCSRGHVRSRVKRAGFYGNGVKRQLYLCTPVLTNDPPHRFAADILPRRPPADGECDECERPFPTTDGPPQPRHYGYPVREIAWALVQVGSGWSYRRVARRLRKRADRHSSSKAAGGTGYSRDARLICDWIEAYAGAVLAALVLKTQPDTILADQLVFRVKALNPAKKPKSGGKDALYVLAVAGHNKGWPVQMLRMEASRGHTVKDWTALLKKVSGTPKRLVCDEEHGIVTAAQALWPNIQVTISPWHLEHRAGEYLRDAGRHAANHPLRLALNVAFKSVIEWTHFYALVLKARATGTKKQKDAINGLKKWASSHNQLVLTQFAQKGWPVSTGALESQLRTVKARSTTAATPSRTRSARISCSAWSASTSTRRTTRVATPHSSAITSWPTMASRPIERGSICDPLGQPTSLRG